MATVVFNFFRSNSGKSKETFKFQSQALFCILKAGRGGRDEGELSAVIRKPFPCRKQYMKKRQIIIIYPIKGAQV